MNLEITKSSQKYDVLESGSLITYSNNADVTFNLTFDDTFAFGLVLEFGSDGEKEHKLFKKVDQNTITLVCTNFDNPLGTGTIQPIELATYGNKKVYLNFWVNALANNSLKKISYTFYIEKDR